MADHRNAPTGASACTDDASRPPRLSVMLIGQRSLATQRQSRYLAGSAAHPARMAPDLAAALIEDYTRPGDLVLDPLAGIGTTLVEAVHAGRNAIGIEIDPGWTAIARANLTHARRRGAGGHGRVIHGDATRLPTGIPTELRGQVSLILTSPPRTRTMRTQSASRGRVRLVDGLTAVLSGCDPLLARDGVMVVVTRPWRRRDALEDLPGLVAVAATATHLTVTDCRRAVHADVRDDRLVARHTPWRPADGSDRRATSVSQCVHDDLTILTSETTS
jgi:modification methylase